MCLWSCRRPFGWNLRLYLCLCIRLRSSHKTSLQEATQNEESPTKDKPALFEDIVKELSEKLQDESLIKNSSQTPVKVEDALAGKEFVLLYFSAHWCPFCRLYTPALIEGYNQVGIKSNVEIIFVPSDRDQSEFDEYFATMPWLAVPFGDPANQSLEELEIDLRHRIPRARLLSLKGISLVWNLTLSDGDRDRTQQKAHSLKLASSLIALLACANIFLSCIYNADRICDTKALPLE
jgi:thiol-disulfide isomerase/thioredoxin